MLGYNQTDHDRRCIRDDGSGSLIRFTASNTERIGCHCLSLTNYNMGVAFVSIGRIDVIRTFSTGWRNIPATAGVMAGKRSVRISIDDCDGRNDLIMSQITIILSIRQGR